MLDSHGEQLRCLISEGRMVVAPGVFDGISAQLVSRMGFPAAYMTGAGIAASSYGLPDVGLVTASEMAQRAAALVDVLGSTPLIADADTGYGSPLNVVRTIQSYERAGVAAIQLEDQAFPKRCGHLPDKELVSEADFLAKLGAALDTRNDALIVARTDARAVLGLSAAIDRANAYADAGADIVFVEAPVSVAEVERVAEEVDAPLLINIVHAGLTPDEGADRLDALGYAVAIHPGDALVSATDAMVSALTDLGGTDPRTSQSGVADFFEVVGLREWTAVGEKWGRF